MPARVARPAGQIHLLSFGGAVFDGPIVLAGGVADGVAIAAAQLLGCDLAYMGTRFIAARESMASDAYRQMLVDSTMDDVILTKAFTGLEASMLRPSILAAGLDPAKLDESVSQERAKGCAQSFAPLFGHAMKRRSWRASIHRAPQPRGSMRARLEIAVKRQLGRIVNACGQRLF